MSIKYYNYNYLREVIKIDEERRAKLRPQTELESSNLREGLIYHKAVLNPLKVDEEWVLVDGHHRWFLLPEVMKECEDFDHNKIPIVAVESKDTKSVMKHSQIGRRNLSDEEIALCVDELVEEGLSKSKAIKQTAEKLNISPNKVKNITYPKIAEQQKERKSKGIKTQDNVRQTGGNSHQLSGCNDENSLNKNNVLHNCEPDDFTKINSYIETIAKQLPSASRGKGNYDSLVENYLNKLRDAFNSNKVSIETLALMVEHCKNNIVGELIIKSLASIEVENTWNKLYKDYCKKVDEDQKALEPLSIKEIREALKIIISSAEPYDSYGSPSDVACDLFNIKKDLTNYFDSNRGLEEFIDNPTLD